MASRRKTPSADAAKRVRHLISLDAFNLIGRLRTRRAEMVALFSRLRNRAPLLEAVRTWFDSVTFAELARLQPLEQQAISRFYEVHGELSWYLRYTEDMPLQIQLRLDEFWRRLEASHRRLTAAIGPPDAEGAPVVDAVVVTERGGGISAIEPHRSKQR
jgi:hypothetical protein